MMDGNVLPEESLDAAALVSEAVAGKPRLRIHEADLPTTARALCDVLAGSSAMLERGGRPGRIIVEPGGSVARFEPFTIESIVIEAHKHCQPESRKSGTDGLMVPRTLPDRVAKLFLALGHWRVPILNGFAASPILREDGSMFSKPGFDHRAGLWCLPMPALQVTECPTEGEARAALMTLRAALQTFPFADCARVTDPTTGCSVADTTTEPGADESAALAALLTAVCRASLDLAPGLMVTAPEISGSGSGKGLLVRTIAAIAFGTVPRPFTAGAEKNELDKRLAAELIEACPVLMLDNFNSSSLRSDTLASVMTERPTAVRVMGETRMVPLNSAAWITVTGNGLTPSEDMARRFLVANLDPGIEDPESRRFELGAAAFLASIKARRAELLSAALTIWRWGRLDPPAVRGLPLGSFEIWCTWVRDPLIALGCLDPVLRVSEAKENDPRRRAVRELFAAWWQIHGDVAMKAAGLAEDVRKLIDPHDRGRQYVAQRLVQMNGTRCDGFVLSRALAAGKGTGSTYKLTQVAR